MNYYNENDPDAAAWLAQLVADRHVPAGIVDTRSIVDVAASDLAGFTQCHFFAGIGGWSLALRRAGWPDDRPVWSGSCPCQPFSVAGKGAGVADVRHLWPEWFRLIAERTPDTVFGEQVADGGGLTWFDIVSSDLEATGHAVGAADSCAASVGAPHIRQRLYFVAMADGGGARLERRREGLTRPGWPTPDGYDSARGVAGRLADVLGAKRSGGIGVACDPRQPIGRFENPSAAAGLRDTGRPGPTNGRWADADWLHCRDSKWRPVEPGAFPLANGIPARVVRLRGYGNAINVEQAATFIKAVMDI